MGAFVFGVSESLGWMIAAGVVTRFIKRVKMSATQIIKVETRKEKLIPFSIASFKISFSMTAGISSVGLIFSIVCAVGSAAFVSARPLIMVVNVADPIVPDTCCNVLFIAVPWGYISFGSWFNPLVIIGIITIDSPNARIEKIQTRLV